MKEQTKQYEEPYIIEEDDYTTGENHQFSHQLLVMKVMHKCLDAGCKEMMAGYFNSKVDRVGNTIKTYIEDTRKGFTEAVKTAEMIMECDLDKQARGNIKKAKGDLKKVYKKLCAIEKKDCETASTNLRKARVLRGIYYREGYLNTKLPYYQEYIEEQVETSRRIFKELTKLTQRKGFYEEEFLTG